MASGSVVLHSAACRCDRCSFPPRGAFPALALYLPRPAWESLGRPPTVEALWSSLPARAGKSSDPDRPGPDVDLGPAHLPAGLRSAT